MPETDPMESGSESVTTATPDSRRLDRALVSGLAWTGAARWSAQAITWAATILLARLLTREDFGIWTSAAVYIGIVTLLSEFGIGASVVMLRNLSHRQVAQINSIALLTGAGAMVLSWVLAVPIARFYGAPPIGPVIALMSIVFVISSFRVVPASLLQRDLRFRFLAVADAVKSILQAFVLVSLAAAGFGYWSFPIGIIAAETTWTILVLFVRRHGFALPKLREIGHAVSFSRDIVVSRLSWYAYSNSDFLVAGRLLGQVAQGEYGMAWNMASVPVEKVNSIIMSVTPAFFSAVQDRVDELRRYITTLTGAISLVAFPAGVGLAIVSPDFVRVVLGANWENAILPIRLLALYAAIRSIGPILTPVLNALGETRFAMWNNVVALIALPSAFLIGSRWGISGVAAGWMVAHPLVLFLLYRRVTARTGLRDRDYLRALWPALNGVLVMAAVVLGAGWLTRSLPGAARLAIEVAAGAASYAAVLLAFHRERVEAIRRILRRSTPSEIVGPTAPPAP
jgi:polysaccharide transporter, PST family